MKRVYQITTIVILGLIIFSFIIYFVLNNSIISKKITNFDACIKAGYPIMESYPRQCRTPDGKTFVEIIDNGHVIGGDRDEYGCLGPAGYSWNETISACIREWEFKSEDERKAINMIAAPISSTRLTVVDVKFNNCSGCYSIRFQRNDNQEYMEAELVNWRIKTDGKVYCTPEDKENKICTKEYLPVCGWFSQNIQCLKYPCAQTFGNKCEACSEENVEYYTEEICPK